MFLRTAIVGLCVVLLWGCKEVKIKDGRVPEAYLDQAKALEGVYVGKFEGIKAQIEIIFDGDKPHLKYSDVDGDDPIDVSCHSKIGDLSSIFLLKIKGEYVLDRVTFNFNPGRCRTIQGRSFELNFSGTQKFKASLLERTEYVQNCSPGGGPPGYGGGGPNCRPDQVPVYLQGTFRR